MATVIFSDVSKVYGGSAAVDSLSLEVREGEFLTLLGPSGCGKTTTLRMLAGFVSPTKGSIQVDGKEVSHLPPEKRDFGMVFQNYVLFPHLTVGENIVFGLQERRIPKAERARRLAELLDLVQLPGIENRYPSQLSGGQQQRIALARALAIEPRVLLMDEPLGALDLKLRESMQHEIKTIQQELGITTIYVTHDQQEALHMSDRIAVMNEGRLEQVDSPRRIYQNPLTRFVGQFVGTMNVVPGHVESQEGGRVIVKTQNGRLAGLKNENEDYQTGQAVTVGVRPEVIKMSEMPEDSNDNIIKGKIRSIAFSGGKNQVVIELAENDNFFIDIFESEEDKFLVGVNVSLVWKVENTHIWKY